MDLNLQEMIGFRNVAHLGGVVSRWKHAMIDES